MLIKIVVISKSTIIIMVIIIHTNFNIRIIGSAIYNDFKTGFSFKICI